MRIMSFALTTEQVLKRTKTQTRRAGWTYAQPGMRIRGVKKGMGRKPGEPLEDVALIEVTAVRREPLADITPGDLVLEGFPGMMRADFFDLFDRHVRDVTVITFRYLDEEIADRWRARGHYVLGGYHPSRDEHLVDETCAMLHGRTPPPKVADGLRKAVFALVRRRPDLFGEEHGFKRRCEDLRAAYAMERRAEMREVKS